MPLYKFGPGDVFYNQLRTYPSSSFYIYSGSVFYQNRATEKASRKVLVNNVPVGHVNLFELSPYGTTFPVGSAADGTDVIGSQSADPNQNVKNTGYIQPFIYKGLSKVAFKNITRKEYNHDFDQGDVIKGEYFLQAGISRRLYDSTAGFNDTNKDGAALRNSLNFAKRLGPHYDFPSGSSGSPTMSENADVNVIYIPSIFYGSEIKKGTVDLRMYITGTQIARCRDSRYDGALIMSGDSENGVLKDGRIVGCVLYNEGAIILNNFSALTVAGTTPPAVKKYSNRTNTTTTTTGYKICWNAFGLGLPQAPRRSNLGAPDTSLEHLPTQDFLQSASFGLEFAGTHKIPTVTMLANANRGELNYTNNPTYIEFGQTGVNPVTSSTFFGEQQLNIKNIHSSSYSDPTGSLKKTTYITKIGIYDDKKKLIGVASVAKPVKKTEDRDLTFKLKLDI